MYEKSLHYFRLTESLKYMFLSWLFCLFSGHSYSCDRGLTGDSFWLSHANFARARIFTALGKMKPAAKKGKQENWLVKTCFWTFNVFFRKKAVQKCGLYRTVCYDEISEREISHAFFRPKRNCDAYNVTKKFTKSPPP